MFTSFVRSIVGAAILSAAVLAALPASADDLAAIDPQARLGPAGWRVDGVTGEATVHRGSVPAARLAIGQIVSIGSEVQTGPGTVVFLSRNGDRLVIQPNSQMRIAEPEPGGLIDHFMQSLGSVFYDVEPRRNRSFGVSAPYVAAVVKGTKFLVTVGPGENSVRVDQGRVLVTSQERGSSVLVDAGKVAAVAATSRSSVTVTESGVPVEAPEDAAAEQTPGDAVETAAESVADTVKTSTSALGKAAMETGNAVGKVSDGVADAVGGAGDAVGGAVGGAGDAVGGAVGGVGDAVGDAVGGPVGDAASTASGAVGGVVKGATDSVGAAVSGVGGAVGGLLGGR